MLSGSETTLFLCIGNPDRGDDAAGLLVANALRAMRPTARIVTLGGNAADILNAITDCDDVVLIDAARSGAPAGTLHRVDDVTGGTLPWAHSPSSHGLGVAEALGLARALGVLPRRCVVYAIEGACFDAGAPASAPVADAARALAQRL